MKDGTMKTKKTTVYIVFNRTDVEISRHKTRKMAEAVAIEIGGYVSKYTVEWSL